MTKYFSTTALSKELQINTKDLFQLFCLEGYIEKENDNWILTEKGKAVGGVVKKHPNYGNYIAWEESIKSHSLFKKENRENLINATVLAAHFGISKFRINPILSELGFVEKGLKGWNVTELGKLNGGFQFEYESTGIPYVCWSKTILENQNLIVSIKEVKGEIDTPPKEEIQEKEYPKETDSITFRDKFEAKLRSADGHYVRSRAEMLIDNWLYMSEIVHAYERKLPVEEELYCDFYLPIGKVYIEYWGLENDPKYLARKEAKLKIYHKYGFNLIEIEDKDILNLDDILPKKLLKFGIQTF